MACGFAIGVKIDQNDSIDLPDMVAVWLLEHFVVWVMKEQSVEGAPVGRIMQEAKDYDIHIRLPEPAEAR